MRGRISWTWLATAFLLVWSGWAQSPLYFGEGGSTPYAADFNGDGFADLAYYDSETGMLSARQLGGDILIYDLAMAVPGYMPAFGDYDNDRRTDLASYDPSGATWYIFASQQGYRLEVLPSLQGLDTTRPVPADYDGDGRTDPALFDSTLGAWIIYASSLGYVPTAFRHATAPGLQPLPADYDGDGRADPAAYDEASGRWLICYSAWDYVPQLLALGGPGWAAAAADFDGDGRADPAAYSGDLGAWVVLHSSSNYTPCAISQGGPGCIPMPGRFYFSDRADLAVYNPSEGAWLVAYESPLAGDQIWQDLACSVLPALLTGEWKQVVQGSIGWGLKLLFDHGQNPEDPHWAEMRNLLNEMNGKLDQLLGLSTAIKSQLDNLSRQMAYDSAQTQILISQLLANQSFASIASLYDSTGPEGYKSFFTFNTNYPPSDRDVAIVVNKILRENMPARIQEIRQAILPLLATERGVLRRWVDMAKMRGVTPDNLLDHYRAFFAYFSTLYSYQAKAGAMYVDASRQAYTSDFQRAATYAWITNDLANTLTDEVEEFRAATYELVLAAIKSADVPANLANPLMVANIRPTLDVLEFYSRKWRGLPTTLCATFLTVNRPNVVSNYTEVYCKQFPDGGFFRTQWEAHHAVRGRPFGYADPSVQRITVSDQYVFIRKDFGRQPHMDLRVCLRAPLYTNDSATYRSDVFEVKLCDDNMRQTSDRTFTNFFGHLFDSPWNHEPLILPQDAAAAAEWAAGANEYVQYPGGQPGNSSYRYSFANNSRANGLYFGLISEIAYDFTSGKKLASQIGVQPWRYAYSYPFIVSNQTDRPVGVRAHVAHSTYLSGQRWDNESPNSDYVKNRRSQNWFFSGGGTIWFSDSSPAYWYRAAPWATHPAGQGRRTGGEYLWADENIVANRGTLIPGGTSVPLRLGVGGQMELLQNCYSGSYGAAWNGAFAWCWVSTYVRRISISFFQ